MNESDLCLCKDRRVKAAFSNYVKVDQDLFIRKQFSHNAPLVEMPKKIYLPNFFNDRNLINFHAHNGDRIVSEISTIKMIKKRFCIFRCENCKCLPCNKFLSVLVHPAGLLMLLSHISCDFEPFCQLCSIFLLSPLRTLLIHLFHLNYIHK